MAESPSHRFGQMVGDLLEEVVNPIFRHFCEERGYYLDCGGQRTGVRKGRKVIWKDKYGNDHDLDFVIEKNGNENKLGRPIAFIEAAWRRYTKHSRNKAQEIQGAVLPIAENYGWDQPFLGAVLAGVFTEGALEQMKSVGFEVLYFPYDSILAAFAAVGLNVKFDESTPDADFRECVNQVDGLSVIKRERVKSKLIELNQRRVDEFFGALNRRLDRLIERVLVIPLHGNTTDFKSIKSAIEFIEAYDQDTNDGLFRKYELIVRFSNNDQITGEFSEKERAIEFLKYVTT